jgi:hypothetical protein
MKVGSRGSSFRVGQGNRARRIVLRFSLTPALSRWERGNRSQSHDNSLDWICGTRFGDLGEQRLLFPLPEGEGQGEGKALFQKSVQTTHLPL